MKKVLFCKLQSSGDKEIKIIILKSNIVQNSSIGGSLYYRVLEINFSRRILKCLKKN